MGANNNAALFLAGGLIAMSSLGYFVLDNSKGLKSGHVQHSAPVSVGWPAQLPPAPMEAPVAASPVLANRPVSASEPVPATVVQVPKIDEAWQSLRAVLRIRSEAAAGKDAAGFEAEIRRILDRAEQPIKAAHDRGDSREVARLIIEVENMVKNEVLKLKGDKTL